MHFEIDGKKENLNLTATELVRSKVFTWNLHYDQFDGKFNHKIPISAKNVKFHFAFKCDTEQWSKNKKPESHLVKLRTVKDYSVSKVGFHTKN